MKFLARNAMCLLLVANLFFAFSVGAQENTTPQSSTTKASTAKKKTQKKKPVMRIAMQDFALEGVDPRVGLLVQNALLVEMRKLGQVSVVSLEEVRAMLEMEAQKDELGCVDESCLVEIASALGADVMLIGTLAKVGDEHLFGLKRISQDEARVVGQVNKRLVAEDGEEFLATIGPAVKTLFPDRDLRQGQTRGVAQEVALRLNPPPLQPWTFWTIAGATSASFTLAAMAGGLSIFNAIAYQNLLKRSQQETLRWEELEGVRTQSYLALGTGVAFAGLTVALATGAGVSALFVDWQGYAEVQE
ncbi:MAG: hypothetical protein GY822_13865 [Deltaproteobacteria bacterium]|nr:hypothetical protein [Deltaproteobacteria bacterium]